MAELGDTLRSQPVTDAMMAAQSSIEELDYIAGHENTTAVVAQAALRAKDALTALSSERELLREALTYAAETTSDKHTSRKCFEALARLRE